MRPSASWAIDSELIRAQGIIVKYTVLYYVLQLHTILVVSSCACMPLRRGAFCALNRLFYFWNRNCLLCVIAETYTKIKQRFYCTYYYIGIPMWQLLSFQEQILIIWWVFWGYCFSNWTLLTENLFVWFTHTHIHTYKLYLYTILIQSYKLVGSCAKNMWRGSKEGIRHLADRSTVST